MLPNEKFALECRDRYAEDGLVVDKSNGEFAHCPLPRSMGDSGYYLLHDDHQWQGLLQSRDVGKRCFWAGEVKRWLETAPFVEGYFELWEIYEEFNSGVHHSQYGTTRSEEFKLRMSEIQRGNTHSLGNSHTEETKRKMSVSHKGKKHSDEHKSNVSKSKKGKPRSEETKRKVSEGLREYWKRKKEVTQ